MKTDISEALKYLDEAPPEEDEGASEVDDEEDDEDDAPGEDDSPGAVPRLDDDELDVVLVADAERVQDAMKSGSAEDLARALLAFLKSAE